MARISAFQAAETGSKPVGVTNNGVSNRQGVCAAWKADGAHMGLRIVTVPLRQNWKIKLVGLAFASKAKGSERVGDRDLSLPPGPHM